MSELLHSRLLFLNYITKRYWIIEYITLSLYNIVVYKPQQFITIFLRKTIRNEPIGINNCSFWEKQLFRRSRKATGNEFSFQLRTKEEPSQNILKR